MSLGVRNIAAVQLAWRQFLRLTAAYSLNSSVSVQTTLQVVLTHLETCTIADLGSLQPDRTSVFQSCRRIHDDDRAGAQAISDCNKPAGRA
jgi:hypothetical protein